MNTRRKDSLYFYSGKKKINSGGSRRITDKANHQLFCCWSRFPSPHELKMSAISRWTQISILNITQKNGTVNMILTIQDDSTKMFNWQPKRHDSIAKKEFCKVNGNCLNFARFVFY